MPKGKAASSSDSNSPLRPPTSLEAQENLMISLAVQCAEKQLRDGTASSQVITHYLKLGSSKERIEKEILEKQKELIEAKTKNLNSNSEAKELYNKALEAFRRYSGAGGDDGAWPGCQGTGPQPQDRRPSHAAARRAKARQRH